MATYYYLKGSVRGTCPHHHRTMTGLATCAKQDNKGCASQGGYSDRRPFAILENGEHVPLGDLQEMDEYFQLLYGEIA